jgi:hypothetical protein
MNNGLRDYSSGSEPLPVPRLASPFAGFDELTATSVTTASMGSTAPPCRVPSRAARDRPGDGGMGSAPA